MRIRAATSRRVPKGRVSKGASLERGSSGRNCGETVQGSRIRERLVGLNEDKRKDRGPKLKAATERG